MRRRRAVARVVIEVGPGGLMAPGKKVAVDVETRGFSSAKVIEITNRASRLAADLSSSLHAIDTAGAERAAERARAEAGDKVSRIR